MFSQSEKNTGSVNDKTYDYLLNAQWDSLILNGNNLLANSVDYFYLRVRMGVAYFTKQNYIKSISHFEKALTFNSGDYYTLEYLYYSCLYMGRKSDANALVKKYPEIFKDKVKSFFFNEIFLDCGINNSRNNTNPLIGEKNNHPNSIKWTEYNLIKNISYAGGGLSYSVHRNILMTAYYGCLRINNTKQIQIFPHVLSDDYKLYQNQFYTNITYRAGRGFSVIPAFHFIMVDYATLFSTYDTTERKVIVDRKGITMNNFAASLAFDKKISKFGFNIFGTISNLNNARQNQFGFILSAFPLGNLNLYTFSTIALKNEQVKKNERVKKNIVFDQKAGTKLFNHLWIEGFITFGNLNNYVEQNAFGVNNTADPIDFRYGTSFIIPIKKIIISIKYQGDRRISYYNYFDNSLKTGKINYRSQMILGSLSWKL
ncbi:MAG: hypothetical protein HY958_02440 [Bacteroidia bacterium]|nr:hypothetical protein [Bacteroidia bacterium]